ncbi:ubiquinol-cytochrome c reductase complex ubiquinone-binding protein [Paracoccidioides lutzii Pb01]|uniref:Cytochrome b-c1 complex subunit 8 n=1 Tax=Paracoccidioides lutzii (strain ATCC MYA-826 / Pb01) TaxID=502779 RepID=C1H113_PARBA|nr:ubiquinol-cytochrome c reductase complex ubiquinone-binding protein [Paracoccidioides lutzii Pb01]EEH33407.1 ubiquinol-cytochrome c reductase complex ubiquinone-binding protein [Paracoccidioides lutzii Pb01]
MGGTHADPKRGIYIGGFGGFGCPTPQKIATYALSPNRQRPLAGALYNAIFNTWRRTRNQALYVVPPFVAAYAILNWAVERNEYLNSKPGRLAEGASEE